MTLTALDNLTGLFGSKLMELDVTFDELQITSTLLKEYLEASILDHIDADPDSPLGAMVDHYGIGNYKDAKEDWIEFQVTFN